MSVSSGANAELPLVTEGHRVQKPATGVAVSGCVVAAPAENVHVDVLLPMHWTLDTLDVDPNSLRNKGGAPLLLHGRIVAVLRWG